MLQLSAEVNKKEKGGGGGWGGGNDVVGQSKREG